MKNKLNQRAVTTGLLAPANKIKAIKSLLCLGVAVSLSSCAMLESRDAGRDSISSRDARPTMSVSSPSVSEAAISELSSGNSVEQQQLIDAINRDGSLQNLPSYRESVPAPVSIPVGEDEDIVELNYEQADLRLILEELTAVLDISIIIDPSIDDKISLRTSANRPLSRDDIWPLIRLLTRDANILLEKVGNIYSAKKFDSGLPIEIVTPSTLDIAGGSASVIMQITPLTYVSTEAAIEVLTPLLNDDGSVIQISSNNLLAISATRSQLQRINQLLLLIDSDPFANQGLHLYQLSNADALELATELSEILILIEGANSSYQVKGIERINSILVTAPANRGFAEISRWITILDADSQDQAEQLFHYQVKNLNAVDLAATLSSVFEEDDELLLSREEDSIGAEPDAATLAAFSAAADGLLTGSENPVASETNQVSGTGGSGGIVSANLRVKIVADEATNSLLIRSTARDYRQLLTTINQLDVVPLQVMINAVIAQITLSDSTKFGVDWSRVVADSAVATISTNTTTGFLPQTDGGLGGLLFTKTFLDGASRVEATLEAIAINNEVELLARPSLTVVNNQEGIINIGSEVPVSAGETISNGLSSTNIQYRDTGIELVITPHINDDGIVNLVITQSLSSVDNGAGGLNGNPVFNNQEITTTVVVRDGENVVLGGLIQTDKEQLNTGVPGLNRIPLLGKLFSYQQQSVERKELFIVIRPEVINLNERRGVQYDEIIQRFDLASEVLERINF
ncbi:MAG: hypothetical protein COC19_03085 [SAR86 cluster bacterium]|uniref:Uncharacterized protein n=1 Tax=SAR86 cluster bacterium TaxID=2030880 RepID=A0A2A4MRA8_9GAMM|nr:MAG: hypothetical protein COC19_03085 [SAR86 cluster bacterium]